MLGECFGTPPVVDDREGGVGLAPVVNVLSVIGNDVAVAGAVGVQVASVEEFEPVAPTGCSPDDLDIVTIELSITEHVLHHFLVGVAWILKRLLQCLIQYTIIIN